MASSRIENQVQNFIFNVQLPCRSKLLLALFTEQAQVDSVTSSIRDFSLSHIFHIDAQFLFYECQTLSPQAVKRSSFNSDKSPMSIPQIRTAGRHTSTPPYVFKAHCFIRIGLHFTTNLYPHKISVGIFHSI
jgi:hypothetical protein